MSSHLRMLERLVCVTVTALLATGCAATIPEAPPRAQPQAPPEAQPEPRPVIRNVILMIGDGMGPQQIGLLQEYATRAPNSIYKGRSTALADFMDAGVLGMSRHGPMDRLVVDSACSATQLAIGVAAPSEVIGLDANGDPAPTILERAKAMGKATGLVSDTRLTHATPAAFAAHAPHRSMENAIAAQMLELGPDVMLSGGMRHWIPEAANDKKSDVHKALVELTGGAVRVKSKRKDGRDLLSEARDAGYQVVFDRQALAATPGNKVLGLFSDSGMMNAIEATRTAADPARTEPSLAEMTRKALDVLARDEDGLFLMVEGGQIDWAGHANDVGTMLHEMIRFDDAARVVYDWAKERRDTLVIVTADHETGGFGFSYARHNLPAARKLPGAGFAERDYKPSWNFGELSILDRLYAQKMSLTAIMGAFKKLDARAQTPEALMALINANTAFPITLEGAKSVLASEPNPHYDPDHKYMNAKEVPLFHDFKEFYGLGEHNRADLIGRAVAAQQNVVWATGAHTHTPVAVIAFGPRAATAPFGRLLHHTDVGQLMARALDP